MQRTDISTAARHYLNEMGGAYVTGTLLVRAIDRAARKLNSDTKFNRADVTLNLRSGAREYTLKGTTMEIYRVRLGTGSDRVTLDATTISALDRDEGDWEAGTVGTPTQYYTDGNIIGFTDDIPRKRSGWVASTAYSVGNIVVPTGSDNGFWYKCNTAGTSAGSQPTWPTTLDGKVTDNNVVWQQGGHTRIYMRALSSPNALTNATTVPTWCPVRYHDTLAKGAALDITVGYLAGDPPTGGRYGMLYREYLQEKNELKALADNRSKRAQARITLKGYSTFRRV